MRIINRSIIARWIQKVQTFDVLVAQPNPLPNRNPGFNRNDRSVPITSKRIRPVVHHAVIVVRDAQIVDDRRVVPIEVGLLSALDGAPVDLHVKVPIRGALHVHETQRVQELVHDGTLAHASVRLQVQLLRSSDVAQVRPATAVLARHPDVVRLGGTGHKLDAAVGHQFV